MIKSNQESKFDVRPLTPKLWPALQELFGEQRTVSSCWCMYWRIGSDYRKRPAKANETALCELVEHGPPPGLLAFDGALVVGWCQLTPRADLPYLNRTRILARIDKTPVWSLSCFYIRKGYRKRGVTSALIASAIEHARRAGAPALEAYPLDAALTPSSSFTGYLLTFKRAGFKIVARHTAARPVVRYEFRKSKKGSAPRTRSKKSK